MEDWWIQRLINPHAMAGLYDEEPPLTDFELHELRLERRGPNCFIRGDLSRFPDHPHASWDTSARRLQVRLSLSAIDHFEASGQVAGTCVDLSIEPATDGFGVAITGRGDGFEFDVAGIGLQIIGMKSY